MEYLGQWKNPPVGMTESESAIESNPQLRILEKFTNENLRQGVNPRWKVYEKKYTEIRK